MQVYTAINHTLQSVFPTVIPFVQHLPSFADCWVCTFGDGMMHAVACEEHEAQQMMQRYWRCIDAVDDGMQGWNMAFTDKSQKVLTSREVDERIADRLSAGQELKVGISLASKRCACQAKRFMILPASSVSVAHQSSIIICVLILCIWG